MLQIEGIIKVLMLRLPDYVTTWDGVGITLQKFRGSRGIDEERSDDLVSFQGGFIVEFGKRSTTPHRIIVSVWLFFLNF